MCLLKTPSWRKVDLELRREKGPTVEDSRVIKPRMPSEWIESPQRMSRAREKELQLGNLGKSLLRGW